ncbi:MAG TPA: bacteriohopanetetrol glucosamine biosynthesis glycosyltransferase HpnI [Bryobacteraceae bacterium]|nr:bacteriohopanetetrol glucosamine biosynthesis glycosyltransferase HpnI [Bryobacteraceae bacterium]
MNLVVYALLAIATFPFIYYLIALYSAARFFLPTKPPSSKPDFTPPISNLKPIRGIDPEAYENFASLCRQDYPDYELLFCVSSAGDPVVPIIEKLARDFPERRIRIIVGSGRGGSNDKVAKLARLVSEARNEVLVINDSDVRVAPDYLKTVVAPLQDPKVGAVTCFYASTGDKTFTDKLQTVGMMSDFFASIVVARQLDGVKFALGTTIATTRAHLEKFGGYESLENRPADDMLVGRLIAEQGYTIELLPYTVGTVADYASFSELFHKRLRWMVVMRHMRPWGHLGMVFTHSLPWCCVAILLHPSAATAVGYLGAYAALRAAMMWLVGIRGLKQRVLWKRMPLIPLWDATAFLLWLASFGRSSIRWRGGDYHIRNGRLVPFISAQPEK